MPGSDLVRVKPSIIFATWFVSEIGLMSFSTDLRGICLVLRLGRPQFFDEKHFVNEAVKYPVAFLENAKLALIEKIFCHRAILKNGYR